MGKFIGKVMICGVDYEVVETEKVVIEGDSNYWGACCYGDARIEILETLSDERKQEVFSHELLHAIFYEAGYEDQDEEMIIRVGKVFHRFLKDERSHPWQRMAK